MKNPPSHYLAPLITQPKCSTKATVAVANTTKPMTRIAIFEAKIKE
jgi:hypothetical protein